MRDLNSMSHLTAGLTTKTNIIYQGLNRQYLPPNKTQDRLPSLDKQSGSTKRNLDSPKLTICLTKPSQKKYS